LGWNIPRFDIFPLDSVFRHLLITLVCVQRKLVIANGKFVSYLRVSTDKQGRSGFGLEAQRAAVETYLNVGRCTLVGEYVEAESGKRSDRPQLAKALAKAIGATVVFAKLDRLTRNVDLLRALVASDVDLVSVTCLTSLLALWDACCSRRWSLWPNWRPGLSASAPRSPWPPLRPVRLS